MKFFAFALNNTGKMATSSVHDSEAAAIQWASDLLDKNSQYTNVFIGGGTKVVKRQASPIIVEDVEPKKSDVFGSTEGTEADLVEAA